MRSPSSSSLTRPLLWLSAHVAAARFVPLLFLPAGVIFLTRIVGFVRLVTKLGAIAHKTPELLLSKFFLPELLLSVALLLFCIELAWMAYVDFNNAALVAIQIDSRLTQQLPTASADTQLEEHSLLSRFFWVVVSTVVLELMGFYTALFSLLWGALIVIFSQLWFNLLAGVQLFPAQSPSIIPFGPRARVDVLSANVIAIVSLCLWPIFAMALPASIGLLVLIMLFLVLKYVPLAYRKWANRP